MTLLHVALVLLAVYALVRFALKSRGKKASNTPQSELATLEPWLTDALVREITRGVPQANASGVGPTLRGNPDADVVSAIESRVRKVDLEFVHYAHESEADVTLRVHYEGGELGTEKSRRHLTDLPGSVKQELSRGVTRVYRAWEFSWARIS